MYAVIKTGGKQYVVKEGDVLSVEKLDAETGKTVMFDRVLLIEDGEQTLIGTPILEKAAVQAEVIENFKDDKILVFKKIRRKQYRRTRGHRQLLTKVRIGKIYVDKAAVTAEEPKLEAGKKEAAPVIQPKPAAPPKPSAAKAERAKAPAKKAVKKGEKEKEPKAAMPKAKAPAKKKTAEKPKTRAKKTSK